MDARAGELWDRMLHSLSHQGIDRDAYLRIAGRTEEDLLAEARPDAEQQLRREAVVAAIIEAEGLEASDEEILEALAPTAQREGTTPKKVLDRLRSAGRLDDVREEVLRAQGDRRRRRFGEGDPARAGRGAREDLDAREGRPGGEVLRALDPGLLARRADV